MPRIVQVCMSPMPTLLLVHFLGCWDVRPGRPREGAFNIFVSGTSKGVPVHSYLNKEYLFNIGYLTSGKNNAHNGIAWVNSYLDILGSVRVCMSPMPRLLWVHFLGCWNVGLRAPCPGNVLLAEGMDIQYLCVRDIQWRVPVLFLWNNRIIIWEMMIMKSMAMFLNI